MGRKQFDFMVGEGLAPTHRLLDVGCGCLRGGIHFIPYLDPGNYVGIDIDRELIEAGRGELGKAGIADRSPTLLVLEDFDVSGLGPFDCAIAQSVFTHLPLNRIMRCVANVTAALAVGGRFYATFFPSPGPRLRCAPAPMPSPEGGFDTHCDADPYFYDPDIFRWMCDGSQVSVDYRGDWDHPRGQHMLAFTRRG